MDVRPRIEVRIGELVLDGVAPDDPRVTDAVTRAVADALPPQARGADPAAIGAAAGDAVARRAGGGER